MSRCRNFDFHRSSVFIDILPDHSVGISSVTHTGGATASCTRVQSTERGERRRRYNCYEDYSPAAVSMQSDHCHPQRNLLSAIGYRGWNFSDAGFMSITAYLNIDKIYQQLSNWVSKRFYITQKFKVAMQCMRPPSSETPIWLPTGWVHHDDGSAISAAAYSDWGWRRLRSD